ncbi:hypothetical protein SH580_05245 [Coraliomargarita algicola]|uniref:Glycoside hydrolase family 5 domain-containing protein n=1 Tax=Coraliomargarita algicola TaxID=3092156 RepID=A0ABZ0RNW9_9BACT|nr:hypothetical protein [Coraliomargarita sp. J2-16]WPJ97111.1 hypothetical protein SH580_05245 [Coraliomargarita sp. J2-16]
MKRICSLLTVMLAALCSLVWSPVLAEVNVPELKVIPELQITDDGELHIDGLRMSAGYIDTGWKFQGQGSRLVEVASGFPRKADTTWMWQAQLPTTEAGAVKLEQSLRPISGHSFILNYRLTGESVPVNESALRLLLPLQTLAGNSLQVDGERVDLPKTFSQARLFEVDAAKHRLCIPAAAGELVISGHFSLLVQDLREWGNDAYFQVRLKMSPNAPILLDEQLGLQLDYRPYASQPLSLREVVNRDFSDAVAGDGQGGWTDQGPDLDLSELQAGVLQSGPLQFEVIDPAANENRAALVLGSREDVSRRDRARVEVDGSPEFRNLYLLHGSAWLPARGKSVGDLVVNYTDGSESRFAVVSGQDIGNWWKPTTQPNAVIGWNGETAEAAVGLYVSRFPLEAKAVESVTLENEANTLWMIVGLTASAQDIPLIDREVPLTVRPGKDWAPYKHSLEIEPGGVFDYSFLLDAPAGKHGALIATPEGGLAFEQTPEKRERFWGPNLTFGANFMSHAEADRLAKRLAMSGYNTVRLHHFDREMQVPGGKSYEMNPKRLDQLFYLFAALKRNGIYMNIDLYSVRSFDAEELASFGMESLDKTMIKGLLPICEPIFDAWARYAQALLTTENPYTGMTLAEDPALIGICPVNEDSLPRLLIVRSNGVGEKLIARYEEAFQAWRAQAGQPSRKPFYESAAAREKAFNAFVLTAYEQSNARIISFLREMGVKALITGSNHQVLQALTPVRESYDYVDMHRYWDHPSFPKKAWSFPYLFDQKQATAQAAPVPREMMPARVIDKPFTVTEFNFIRPNQYRAEGGVLMPAYASLQGWDALYNFQYAKDRKTALEGSVENYFALAADPIGLIADRVSALLFQREDIATAQKQIAFAVAPDAIHNELMQPFPEDFETLGLVTGIGSLYGEAQSVREQYPHLAAILVDAEARGDGKKGIYPADASVVETLERDGVLPAGAISDQGRRFRSDTGEIVMDTQAGTVSVVTPRSELFVLNDSQQAAGEIVQVHGSTGFSTLSLVSIDGAPLVESSRMLLTHLTDALPEGMRFGHQDRKLLLGWGSGPHLVKRGSAEITLRLPEDADWQIWAVDATGKRVREYPSRQDADGLHLTLSTVSDAGVQLAYEIVR